MRDLQNIIKEIESSLDRIEFHVRQRPANEDGNAEESAALRRENEVLKKTRKDLAQRIDRTINRLKAVVGEAT